MNEVLLKGNLTRDPELSSVGDTQVVNFGLAVNRFFTKKDGERGQKTTFIDCEAWDTGAELINKLMNKGDPVLIKGAIVSNSWDDKDTGKTRIKHRIRVEKFEKLARYRSNSESSSNEEQTENNESADDSMVENEQIPF